MSSEPYSGPFDYLVFAFPPRASVTDGLRQLLEAVESGLIEVLDLECVGRDGAGRGVRLTLADLKTRDDLDLTVFEGVESRILDQGDLDTIAADLEPSGFALALVYVEHSLDRTAQAWLAVGGRPVLTGGIDPVDLQLALDSTAPQEDR